MEGESTSLVGFFINYLKQNINYSLDSPNSYSTNLDCIGSIVLNFRFNNDIITLKDEESN